MSKGKLAAIMIGCAVLIVAVIALGRIPQTTSDTEVYFLYLEGQFTKVLDVMSTLDELTKEPRPSSLTWQYEVTNCLEELEQVKDELTATRPPRSLSDKYPEIADKTYERALQCLRLLTRASYLRVDYARTGDISYLEEATVELLKGQLCHGTLLVSMESTLLRLSMDS